MSDRPVSLLLSDILSAIDAVLSYTENLNTDTFEKDKMRSEAVIRNIEIIGEAVNRLPDDFLARHSGVEWHKAVSMRNRLIHGYFSVDNAIVFNTAKSILPSFRRQIVSLMEKLDSEKSK